MKVITVVNNHLGQIWQVHAYLENLKEIGWIGDTEVLVYTDDDPREEWEILKTTYPTAGFFFYKGDDFTRNIIPLYLPIIRPYTLKQHFSRYLDLEAETVVYTDADILWTSTPDMNKYKQGCYVSTTVYPSDYQSHEYLLSKTYDVLPERLELYKTIDVIQRLANIVGITKEQIINSKDNCGGVQYILNGVDWRFWDKVMVDCLSIRVELQNINQQFMRGNTAQEREDNGFQSWCADLWSVFYNLLYFGYDVRAPRDLDFSWSSDTKERMKETHILHNAGITSDATLRTNVRGEDGNWQYLDAPAFYKGKYTHSTPFTDLECLKAIVDHPVTSKYCNHTYAEHLLKMQQKYELNY